MSLKEKLIALGFKKTCIYNQYEHKATGLYVYISYNKITSIQETKTWCVDIKKFDYKEHLKAIRELMNKVNKLL